MSLSTTPVLRPMTSADLDAVMAIEQRCYPFPWTRGIFSDCLRVGYVCRVVEAEKQLLGYGVMSHGAQEAHILNLCVCPESRRHGYARVLLQSLLRDAKTLGADTVLLEVRVSNSAAIALYSTLGFNEIGLRKGYYPAERGREDALLFALALGPEAR